VDDPLLAIIHIEQRDPRRHASLACLRNKCLPTGHQRFVAAADPRVDDMVHNREHAMGINNGPLGRCH
jgi:hypothetical protein